MTKLITLPILDERDDGVEISRFELVRLVAGELPSARRAHIESLARTDPALASRVEAVREEQRALEGQLQLDAPLPRFLEEHAQRKARTPGVLRAWRWPLGGAALATAAALLVVVRAAPEQEAPSEHLAAQYDGLKGHARIGFFVSENGAARAGLEGETLSEGARVQFTVLDVQGASAMVVIGVDGRGEVTLYAAEDLSPRSNEALSRPRVLAQSVALDDALGPERFFVVYGEGPKRALVDEVMNAARALAQGRPDLRAPVSLPLVSARAQSSVHIVKVPAR